MLPQIKFRLLHPDAKLPTRAHDTDACFDVWSVERTIGLHFANYRLGFATEIPEGWAGYFYPRSSICNTDLILTNGVGVIDAGYRGEWQAKFLVTNERDREPLGRHVRMYEPGDRIGQIRFAPLPQYELVLADELSTTERGAGGFGSTGK